MQTREHVNAFVKWAKENIVEIESFDPQFEGKDLEAIASAIGDEVQIVALSEGCHNNKQMMSLHDRIIRYLIEYCGFTIVATESGLPESKLIHDYVQNNVAVVEDVEAMYQFGLNKMYSQWQEGRNLIEWMREYNQKHPNKLQYYGLDIGGFYQNWKNPMDQICNYLEKVDSEFAKMLKEKLSPFIKVMTENAAINYNEKLSLLERAQLAIILQEAVENFDSNEEKYISDDESNRSEFEWARQSMISMQLAENYYQNILDIKNSKNSKFSGLNGRETAMHLNMKWILETQQRQRPNEKVKIIWINHVIHTKTETQYHDDIWRFLTPAGQMICETVGRKNVFIIGLVYGEGKYWKNWQKPSNRSIDVIPAPKNNDENGIEPILSAVKKSNYFIHWDHMLFNQNFPLGSLFSMSTFFMRENDYFIKIRPMEWNACIYLNEVDPATPVMT